MNPAIYIRKRILAMTQKELAQVLNVTQPTVWRWEQDGRFPSEHQPAIRQMGMRCRPDWSDAWFFELPADPPGPAVPAPEVV